MSDLFVSWSDYHQTIEKLAAQIYESNWRFDQVLAVGRGGLRIGDTVSRLFKVPMAVVQARSVSGSELSDVRLSRHIAMVEDRLGPRVLVVDDLLDSGTTLALAKERAVREGAEVRTAVLWRKACASFEPDYCVRQLDGDPWVHQPYEAYELVSLEELRARVKQES